MISARWLTDSNSRVWHLECSGHAGFNEDGPDLLCAAVSALTGSLGLGFSKVLNIPHEVTAQDGHFFISLSPEHQDHPDFPAAQALLRSVVLALQELTTHYPGFIEVEEGKKPGYE